MKKAPVSKAEKFWDRAADSYDREESGDGKIYRQIIEMLKSHLKPTDRVLDFGCGTGLLSNEIAASVKKVCALDISSKMIENARAKAEAGTISNIDHLHANIFDERLEVGTFDVVMAFYILHLVEDAPSVIKRIHELLKPGGLLISATPCMGEKPLLNGLFSLLGKTGLVPKMSAFKLPRLEKLLTDGGLQILESSKLQGTTNQYFIISKK